ncbi:Tetrapyrrole-binding protein, chloroplastic [Apostasia shenzhenica]|uniref:Tetrapyrrole-binding protein, chloroplastic n=1 Tax=Apostasia shenzhenica TaxID=1088818 RepID=A0A2I0AL30_9ASPA|nr:Tetrapyrrole-binding protein, chloroplastic [Apostasia shenzhenica]
MATASLQSPHHPHLYHCRHRRHFPSTTTSSSSSSIFPTLSLSSSSSSTSTTATLAAILAPVTSSPTFDALAGLLAAKDFQQADEVTRRLLIALAGEAAEKRGYVYFSEVQFIAHADLQAIDTLWLRHSAGRFGYSVQRRIWKKARRDFTRFFIKVGWMRRLETEVEQYTYRSFPGEFIWELGDGTPEGHLPLTNALRGTQLLGSILTHLAFEVEEEEEEESAEKEEGEKDVSSSMRLFKPDYSF